MIYIGFLLHIYQPPTQTDSVLEKITSECYRPLFQLLSRRSDAHLTVNMNWSLTELFTIKGYDDVLGLIRESLRKRTIEITGTAAYHPILPLIPREERLRQIELNQERNREVLGRCYRPKGFFLPELAYGHEVIESLQETGYQWTITEDIPFMCLHPEVPYNYIACVDGFPIFLRSSLWSNKISLSTDESGKKFSGDQILSWMIHDLSEWMKGEDGYVIIAMDGETFGHHIPGYIELFLEQFLDGLRKNRSKIRMLHISDLVHRFPKVEKQVPPGSWSTSAEDFWEGNFFPLWKNKYNEAHKILWELTDLAIASVHKLQDRLDKSLNSCTFWWAARSPREFAPITYAGIQMLIDVIRLADPENLPNALRIKEELEERLERRAARGWT